MLANVCVCVEKYLTFFHFISFIYYIYIYIGIDFSVKLGPSLFFPPVSWGKAAGSYSRQHRERHQLGAARWRLRQETGEFDQFRAGILLRQHPWVSQETVECWDVVPPDVFFFCDLNREQITLHQTATGEHLPSGSIRKTKKPKEEDR